MPAAWQFGNGNGNGVALNNGGTMLAGDTSCTISNAATLGSPTSPRFMLLIDSELIEADAVAGNVYSSLLRGQEGTTAASHLTNATVFLPITAGMMTGAFLRADATNAVEVTGTDFKPSGLTGATSASRYVGGTGTDAAPASGTFAVGDFAVSQLGRFYVCTVAGTPGTWVSLASLGLANTFAAAVSVTAEVTAKDFKATGVASLGNPQNGRYVGSWTTAGPPTGLTAAVADYGFDGNGNIWFCTVAGTPGTWRAVGLHRLDSQSGTNVANITLTVPAASVGFYGTLILEIEVISAAAGAQGLVAQFNSDVAGNYDWSIQQATNVTNNAPAPTIGAVSGRVGAVNTNAASAGAYDQGRVVINNADSTTLRKNYFYTFNQFSSDAAAGTTQELGHGQWRNVTQAISTIKLFATANNMTIRARMYGEPN